MNYSIDINCDMGEEMPTDALIMPFISSANIACGYHAGNETIMRKTIELALQNGVAIGAHPSFPDRVNFGRKNMHFELEEIYVMVQRQLEILANIAVSFHTTLHHIKPHGALYNMAAKDEKIALAIARAVQAFDKHLIVYGLSGSIFIQTAQSLSLKTCQEVFADRTYQQYGSLTPRSQANALIKNDVKAKNHILQMIRNQSVRAINGDIFPVLAETVCIHGDGEHAVAFAQMIHQTLIEEQIKIIAP